MGKVKSAKSKKVVCTTLRRAWETLVQERQWIRVYGVNTRNRRGVWITNDHCFEPRDGGGWDLVIATMEDEDILLSYSLRNRVFVDDSSIYLFEDHPEDVKIEVLNFNVVRGLANKLKK